MMSIIELTKEDHPGLKRPLRLSEIKEELPKVAWVENVFDLSAEPKIPKGIKKNSYWGDMLSFTDGDDIAIITYGVTWRVWANVEPTKQEMENAKWIKEEKPKAERPVRII